MSEMTIITLTLLLDVHNRITLFPHNILLDNFNYMYMYNNVSLKEAPPAVLMSKKFMLLPTFEKCIAPAPGFEPRPYG